MAPFAGRRAPKDGDGSQREAGRRGVLGASTVAPPSRPLGGAEGGICNDDT